MLGMDLVKLKSADGIETTILPYLLVNAALWLQRANVEETMLLHIEYWFSSNQILYNIVEGNVQPLIGRKLFQKIKLY